MELCEDRNGNVGLTNMHRPQIYCLVALLQILPLSCGCEEKRSGTAVVSPSVQRDVNKRADQLGRSVIRELTARVIELDDSFRSPNEIYDIAKQDVKHLYRDEFKELAKLEGSSEHRALKQFDQLLEDNRLPTVNVMLQLRERGETFDLGKEPFDQEWVKKRRVITRPWFANAYRVGVPLLAHMNAENAAKDAIEATSDEYAAQLREIITVNAKNEEADMQININTRFSRTQAIMTRQLWKYFSVLEKKRASSDP